MDDADESLQSRAQHPPLSLVKTDQYLFEVYGSCPVQADGAVLGHPLYFRARWDQWTLSICTTHDDAVFDGPEGCDGFFGDHEFAGFYISGTYGSHYDAGYMPLETAIALIEKGLQRFLEGYPMNKGSEPGSPPEEP